MYLQAVSRRNINRWHAIPEDTSILPTFVAAVCGAPVINPSERCRSSAAWYFHGTDDGTNRNWGACKRCAAIVAKRFGADAS
jgi:hypothetical protein